MKGTNLIQVICLFLQHVSVQGLVWCCPCTRPFLAAATVEGDTTLAGSTERTVEPVLRRCASLQAGGPQEHHLTGRKGRRRGGLLRFLYVLACVGRELDRSVYTNLLST